MAAIQRNVFFVLLLLCAKSLGKSFKESKLEEISEVFNEIEKSQFKLKKAFQEILTEELGSKDDNIVAPTGVDAAFRQAGKEEENCRCIPYHLCYPETGEQINDGRFLLESRSNSYICEDPNEVCCLAYSPSNARSQPLPNINFHFANSVSARQAPAADDATPSVFGEFPWTIMITKAKKYTCVGSLIHPKVVLTAAHCVNETDNYAVRAGDWNVNTRSEPLPHQNRKIVQIIRHPYYCGDNSFNDVALLITDQEFQLQKNVNTVCLAKSTSDTVGDHSEQCLASGWGITTPSGPYNKIMAKIGFSLASHEQCRNEFRATRLGSAFELYQSFICAYGQNGSDTCQGNGGAPLVCPLAKQPNRSQQVGIASWGIGCAGTLPSVFTKISAVREWIDQQFDFLKLSKQYYA